MGRHNQLDRAWFSLAGVPPCGLSVHSHGVAPLSRLVVRRVRTDVAPLFRLAVSWLTHVSFAPRPPLFLSPPQSHTYMWFLADSAADFNNVRGAGNGFVPRNRPCGLRQLFRVAFFAFPNRYWRCMGATCDMTHMTHMTGWYETRFIFFLI